MEFDFFFLDVRMDLEWIMRNWKIIKLFFSFSLCTTLSKNFILTIFFSKKLLPVTRGKFYRRKEMKIIFDAENSRSSVHTNLMLFPSSEFRMSLEIIFGCSKFDIIMSFEADVMGENKQQHHNVEIFQILPDFTSVFFARLFYDRESFHMDIINSR